MPDWIDAAGEATLRAFLGFLASALFSAFGWWLGAQVDVALAVVLSAVGAGVGLYWGRRFYDEWLD